MNGPRLNFFTIVPAALVALAPHAARATQYLTVEAAQQAIFPGARFIERDIAFTPEQRKQIARASGVGTFDKVQKVWDVRSEKGRVGWFMLDRVIGKHDMISYVIGLTADGAVSRVEILEYRETYGGEIRNPAWRQQFVGKHFGSTLQLDKDIRNISGATLSSRHVTDGIRRLLATWELLLKNG